MVADGETRREPLPLTVRLETLPGAGEMDHVAPGWAVPCHESVACWPGSVRLPGTAVKEVIFGAGATRAATS